MDRNGEKGGQLRQTRRRRCGVSQKNTSAYRPYPAAFPPPPTPSPPPPPPVAGQDKQTACRTNFLLRRFQSVLSAVHSLRVAGLSLKRVLFVFFLVTAQRSAALRSGLSSAHSELLVTDLYQGVVYFIVTVVDYDPVLGV